MAGSPFAVVAFVIRVYSIVIIVDVLISWLPPDRRPYELHRFTTKLTEPVLKPIRALLPRTGGIDFSPLVAIVLLEVLQRFVLSI